MKTYDYWSWNSLLDHTQIKEINQIIESNFYDYENDEMSAHKEGKKLKTSLVKTVHYAHLKSKLDHIVNACYMVNECEYGFDLYPYYDSEVANLNIYSHKNNSAYDWHVDVTKNVNYDLKFTVLINLSEVEYEGGTFQLFNTEELSIQDIGKPGSVLMFKSFLSHRVLPVTKGERKTLALFLRGPRFR